MKKLSETYKELGIDFTFPIEIKDADGNETYYEDSDGFWLKYEYDADGNETYYESSLGHKEGTPKAFITLDREETILFADILKAAPAPPTPEFKQALRAYRDFIIKHKQ